MAYYTTINREYQRRLMVNYTSINGELHVTTPKMCCKTYFERQPAIFSLFIGIFCKLNLSKKTDFDTFWLCFHNYSDYSVPKYGR